MSAFIAPELRLRAFRPFDQTAIEVPLNLISEISSTRSLSGGGINLRMHGQRKLSVQNETIKRLRELLPEQTVVALSVRRRPGDKWRQLNMGYVRNVRQEFNANGQITWTPSIVSLDQRFADQSLFIDLQDATHAPGVKKKQGSAITQAILAFPDLVREMRTAPLLARTIWDKLIYELLNKTSVEGRPATRGGKPLIGPVGSGESLLDFKVFEGQGYSEGFLHVLHIANSFRFGENVNFYQLLLSLVTPPLYELFFDPLEGTGQLGDGKQYAVKADQSLLVYRKTPFDLIFDEAGFYRADQSIPEIQDVSSIMVETVAPDLYTGVHIGPGVLDTAAATLQFPPTHNDLLGALHGFNVLRIKLSGIGFPREADSQEQLPLNENLKRIQEMLFRNFCGGLDGHTAPLRNTVGRASAGFDFYRVGAVYALPSVLQKGTLEVIREFWHAWKGKSLPDRLEDFGRFAYVSAVTDTFSLAGKKASSSLDLKWIDRIQ
jgi:hypothetical protein